MRLYAMKLNNDIKGIAQRKQYIDSLIFAHDFHCIIVLSELVLCSYMAGADV